MLGKLMKYEIKAQYKSFCGMYLFVALIALISGICNGLKSVYAEVFLFEILTALTTATLVIAIIVMLVASTILFLLRYRRNLLKDEGYLMHTLPVSAASLVNSKLLVSVCWYLCDGLVAYLAVALSSLNMRWPSNYLHYMEQETGQQITGVLIAGFAVYCFSCIVTSIVQLYASLSIGYTSVNSNRDVMSFIAYMATYVISQVMAVIGLVIVVLREHQLLDSMLNNVNPPIQAILSIFVMAGIVMAILGIAYYIISIMMIRKKLNLE